MSWAYRDLENIATARTARLVEPHIGICVLAYLLATRLEQRLAQTGLTLTAAQALAHLAEVRVVDQQWGDVVLTDLTRPFMEPQAILRAFDLPADATLVRTSLLSGAQGPPPLPH